ncbi:MAG: tetratricopeptide repeat protein [Desulfobacterium sp.]|nr:tetratricopeptide repeat protein [Desulfobacterium sp.]
MVDKISNARKKELEQPDPFLETLQGWVNTVIRYKKQVAMVLGAIVAVVAVFSATLYSIGRSEDKASEFLARVLSNYNDTDPVKGYETVKDDVAEFISSYPNTAASAQARVRFAKIAFDAGKLEEAHGMYLGALDKFKGDKAMENLLFSSLGRTTLALGKMDEAETWFRKIVTAKGSMLKGEALFNLGLILADRGDSEQSQQLLQEVVRDHGDSIYAPMAEARIQRL